MPYQPRLADEVLADTLQSPQGPRRRTRHVSAGLLGRILNVGTIGRQVVDPRNYSPIFRSHFAAQLRIRVAIIFVLALDTGATYRAATFEFKLSKSKSSLEDEIFQSLCCHSLRFQSVPLLWFGLQIPTLLENNSP